MTRTGQAIRTPRGAIRKMSITPPERRNIPKEILMLSLIFSGLSALALLVIFAAW